MSIFVPGSSGSHGHIHTDIHINVSEEIGCAANYMVLQQKAKAEHTHIYTYSRESRPYDPLDT